MKINFINCFIELLVLLFYKIKNYLDCANFYTKKTCKTFLLAGIIYRFLHLILLIFFIFLTSQLSFNSYKKTSTTTFLALLFNPYKKVSTTIQIFSSCSSFQLFNPYKKVSTTFHVPAFWTYMCCLILIKRHLQHYITAHLHHVLCCLILIKRHLQH